jgi:hypothetical protein
MCKKTLPDQESLMRVALELAQKTRDAQKRNAGRDLHQALLSRVRAARAPHEAIFDALRKPVRK